MNVPTKPSLNIMLDTNVLYVDGRSDQFLSPNIVKVIEDPLHAQLNISWSIPSMVRREREYQLRQQAKHIVSAAREMPSLFASTWVGDSDAVNAEISQLAQRELHRLNIRVYECDPNRVAWATLIEAAGWRLPPFDPNDKNEKGFKDAIVAETFIQLCGELTAHGVDTAILVTSDAMLREHVEGRVGSSRVKVLRNIDALTSELNFLVSDIDPDTAAQLQPMANELLANAGEFWDNVGRIAMPYCYPPYVLPTFAVTDIEFQTPSYSVPVFLRKEMRRVFFFSRYSVPRTGKQWLPAVSAFPPPVGLLTMGAAMGGGVSLPSGAASAPRGLGMPPPPNAPFAAMPTPPGLVPLPPNDRYYGLGMVTDVPSLGHIQTIILPSINFAVEWSADYDVSKPREAAGGTPIIGRPRIESLSPEPM
ncbi:hypothetical protein R75461_03743 [Paraburkholderia nemoris]|uniref:PIN domain-containing protein n=1 Tax=Paraburkholderia nemoris TaxID=2793076 RepID=UPI00190C3078|nr:MULTISPECIES: PIN domain-containing protein [Paraburkholderia]MBK3778726.1 DUF4935 domain-containing protein [Paraburkholderia aspalathi]CAE6769077.1 hypothetical protein R75461_03743 [Paraburkholderia nemoris]